MPKGAKISLLTAWHDNAFFKLKPYMKKKSVIAIFEDDVVNRFIYSRLFHLRQEEIEVHIFGNPEEGYAVAKDIAFDVVFIEVHFWKNFGGIDILSKLKEISNPNMIAVAMIALLQIGDLENIMAAGFSMCLEKPVVFTKLNLSEISAANPS
jgi:DNA-binding NtrC family response regulator